MLKDGDIVSIVCKNCGHESEKEVGWLQARAGRGDFICANCGTSFQDYTKQLEFIRNDTSNAIRKLRLYPLR